MLWWLDDGCLVVHEKKNGISISRFGYLCTEHFNRENNELLSEMLYQKFGLITKVHIDRGGVISKDATYYRLYLNATSMRNFIDTVRPWLHLVPESMKYKISMDYRPNRLQMSAIYAHLYNF